MTFRYLRYIVYTISEVSLMSFATRLKEQRERIGLTQVDLATALGVTKGAVGNYETGASSPKAEILYQLFDILHCDANYLFHQTPLQKRWNFW